VLETDTVLVTFNPANFGLLGRSFQWKTQ